MKAPFSAALSVAIISTFGGTSCTALRPYKEPGIQPDEARVLTKSYYWRRGVDPERFSDAEIQHFFERTRTVPPTEGGERSEILGSQLIWTLAAAGDTHFASLLSAQPQDIQSAVLHYIKPIWTYKGLHYPATEALAQ